MAVEVWRWVWQHSRSKRTERLVLLAIADCCNRADGSGAWPSMAELVRKTTLSERGVQTALARLVNLGELDIERNTGRGGVNRYRVLMNPAPDAPPHAVHPAGDAGGRTEDEPQVETRNPARGAPPQDMHPPQAVRGTPARGAPGTTNEPPTTQNPSTSETDVSTVNPIRDDVEQLCTRLAEWIVKNGNKAPTVGKRWRDAARLLIDVDERELSKALALIEWSQRNEFWRRNIQSMSKFREKYDALRLQANDEWATNARGGSRFETPASNAPKLLPASEKCEEHHRPKTNCGFCAADRKGKSSE